MLTLFLLVLIFMGIGVLAAAIVGLVAISPILLVILLLPMIDVLILKAIFKKKK